MHRHADLRPGPREGPDQLAFGVAGVHPVKATSGRYRT